MGVWIMDDFPALIIFLSMILLFMWFYPQKTPPEINLSCPKTVLNSSCPNPSISVSTKFDSYFNYIQAPHTNVYFEKDSGKVIVYNAEIIEMTGKSMRPTMFTGNKALAIPYHGGEVEEGWIIMYHKQGKGYITHRITGVYKDTVTVQGDNNNMEEIVNKGDIKKIIVGVLYT